MTDAVIKCESVYKIFGENAKKMLEESNGNVDAKTFQEKGCIVGVNNASFDRVINNSEISSSNPSIFAKSSLLEEETKSKVV